MRHLTPVLMLTWLACACNAADVDPKAHGEPEPSAGVATSDFAWDGHSRREHRDAPSTLRFPVPVTGYRVTATHFDPTTPPVKLKHELVLEQDRTEVVRLDVWHDTEQLGLTAWFDEYLRFMLTRDAVVELSRAGRRRVDAIMVRHPRSPHARARRAVVLEVDGRIVRVTCLDEDDQRALSVFQGVVDGLELEAKP